MKILSFSNEGIWITDSQITDALWMSAIQIKLNKKKLFTTFVKMLRSCLREWIVGPCELNHCHTSISKAGPLLLQLLSMNSLASQCVMAGYIRSIRAYLRAYFACACISLNMSVIQIPCECQSFGTLRLAKFYTSASFKLFLHSRNRFLIKGSFYLMR